MLFKQQLSTHAFLVGSFENKIVDLQHWCFSVEADERIVFASSEQIGVFVFVESKDDVELLARILFIYKLYPLSMPNNTLQIDNEITISRQQGTEFHISHVLCQQGLQWPLKLCTATVHCAAESAAS
jgi:hypothetical protein